MSFNREEALKAIIDGISWIETMMKFRGAVHLFDSHIVVQEVFRRLLNELYGLQLVATDNIHQNFPAIDLGDQENKRAFQVTAEKDGKKIQQTLDAYAKHDLAPRYGKLQMIIIGERQGSYGRLVVPPGMDFVWKDDIIDTKGMIQAVNRLETERLEHLAEIIRREVHLPDTKVLVNRRFQLPAFCADFTGREAEIQRMSERITSKCDQPYLLAVRGMGGVGKTTLAVRVAHQVKDTFLDAQLFIDLKGTTAPLTPANAMRRIICDLHPELENLPDDENALVSLYRGVLQGTRALIILDNAHNEAQVQPLLTVPPPVGFIITCRNSLGLDCVESIPLEMLSPTEAQMFLRGVAGEKGTREELDAVARLCGRLPLALRVAGDFLRLHDNWSVKRFAEALDKERLKWLKGKTENRDVEVVLRFSARMLVEESSELAKHWQMLSVFPGEFFELAASAVWQLKSEAAVYELTALLDRSLVKFDKKTGRYDLHDLMRPIARDPFGGTRQHLGESESADRMNSAERRFSRFFCQVLQNAECTFLEGDKEVFRGLRIFDLEEANIRQGWIWANQHRTHDRFAAELSGAYADFSTHVASLRMSPWDLIDLLSNSIEAFREIGDRYGEGRVLGSVGRAYLAVGEVRKAIHFHAQHLSIARELNDLEGVGSALGNLGIAYCHLCEFAEAIEYHEQQLKITRDIGSRRGEGIALGSLGNVYSAMGENRKAIVKWEQHVEIAREIGDRHSESVEIGNLGIAYRHLGEIEKSKECHMRHLSMARQLGDRHGEGRALNNLGLILLDTGHVDQAVQYFEQDLSITREFVDRQGEANVLGNIGIAHHRLGLSKKATEYFRQQLTIARDTGDRRGEGNALGCLGSVCGDAGDFESAMSYFEQRLAIAREIGDRSAEGMSDYCIALLLENTHRRDRAIKIAREALLIFEEIGSPIAESVRVEVAKWTEDNRH